MKVSGKNAPSDCPQDGVGRRGLRVRDAAHYCGCSVHAIRNAIRVGKLRAKMIGRALIILKDDADSFLEALPCFHPLTAGPVVVQSVITDQAEERQAA